MCAAARGRSAGGLSACRNSSIGLQEEPEGCVKGHGEGKIWKGARGAAVEGKGRER